MCTGKDLVLAVTLKKYFDLINAGELKKQFHSRTVENKD
jgi:hypothetical protein